MVSASPVGPFGNDYQCCNCFIAESAGTLLGFFENCGKTFYLNDISAVDKEYAVAHIFVGLFMVALGVWGLFEEYYFVIDFLKGFGPIVLIAGGLLATLAGCVPPKSEEGEAHGEN